MAEVKENEGDGDDESAARISEKMDPAQKVLEEYKKILSNSLPAGIDLEKFLNGDYEKVDYGYSYLAVQDIVNEIKVRCFEEIRNGCLSDSLLELINDVEAFTVKVHLVKNARNANYESDDVEGATETQVAGFINDINETLEKIKIILGAEINGKLQFKNLEIVTIVTSALYAVIGDNDLNKHLAENEIGRRILSNIRDIRSALIEIIFYHFRQKYRDIKYGRTNEPLDLNMEIALLDLLEGDKWVNAAMCPGESWQTELSRWDKMCDDFDGLDLRQVILGYLHHRGMVTDEMASTSNKYRFSCYIKRLFNEGKFREILRSCIKGPFMNSTTHIAEEAIKKLSYVIEQDENGLPCSKEAIQQYSWADFGLYRSHYRDERYPGTRNDIFKRASVSELLRKLVNKDLGYGEFQDAKSTSVGLYWDNDDLVNDTSDSLVRCRIPSCFEETKVPVIDLFAQLELVLQREMHEFLAVLENHFGAKYQILPSRVKSAESILLKMLKEEKTRVEQVTDLIGFTILTDTEDETEQLTEEVKALMSSHDLKVMDMWTKPSSRGRRSMDITGIPKGFDVRMQVQCRTKKLEREEFGKLANHTAYKVFSGRKLLEQINGSPDKYLDMLYQALHNVRVAYELLSQNPTEDAATMLKYYDRDYKDFLSIVRTSTLY